MNTKIKKTFGIIGYPLKNPRSIKIWKKFFKQKKINAEMLPFEINKKKIDKFFLSLLKNKNFHAAAITMPYKKYFYKKSVIKDKLTLYAKSVNLILKIDEKIFGYNTDIIGALSSIPKKTNKIVIIGQGGTGQALLNVLFNIRKKTKFILRKSKKNYLKSLQNLNNKSKRINVFSKINDKIFDGTDLIINCTPLGSDLKKNFINKSPINESYFNKINKNTKIFDVVYKPKKTKLYYLSKKYKINYINGIKMNTIQAISALKTLSRNLELN